jgi:hypothetical protein
LFSFSSKIIKKNERKNNITTKEKWAGRKESTIKTGELMGKKRIDEKKGK